VVAENRHITRTSIKFEELSFVFNPVRTPASVSSRLLATFALTVLAGLGSSLHAQTAPQLLPYTSRLIAGSGTVAIAKGAPCPVSGNPANPALGNVSVDAYGDGCLATEILLGNNTTGKLPGARSAVADANGNVFFTDYNNALVRRVDVATGIVTAVAGGQSGVCGGVSTDASGDGCLGTYVKLTHPSSLAFAPNGDLYFGDPGAGQVRKIAATGGFITSSGVISLPIGSPAGTYGYAASNPTTTITSATSFIRAPYGLSFDTKGDLFVVDEYTEAIIVLNTNATGTNTVNGVAVPAGTIWKIAGSLTPNTVTYCTNGSSGTYGCAYGLYVENVPANGDQFDSTYSVAVGPDGTVYAGVEYYDSVFKVSPAGILSTFAGMQDAVGTKPTIGKRGPAGSFGIGSIFGTAADTSGNVYFTDASSGVVWRVDAAGLSQYVVAGGAATPCSMNVDAYGDSCPALQSQFGSSGTGNYATTTLPGPGIYGVSVDAYSDLFIGDTETNLVREVASGTQFGVVGANQPTDIIDIHLAAGDTLNSYTITAGANNFSIGTAACTKNTGTSSTDATTDCLIPITATPTVLGPFSGTLTVSSQTGGTATFPLTGIYEQSPITRTAVSYTAGAVCAGTTTYSTSTPITLTATVTANGPNPPGGTITFFANGIQIASPQNVKNLGTTAAPVYGATLTNTTFSTIGTYTFTATYSGDSYFKPSTGTDAATLTTAAASFTTALTPATTATNPGCPAGVAGQCTVAPGQTALYSFGVKQLVYTGSINFACTGLPANSSCVFYPSSITASGCSVTSTVALSIITQAPPTILSGLGSTGRGAWQRLTAFAGLSLALLIGLRRRRGLRHGQLWMALALLLAATGTIACSNGVNGGPATPAGSYTITITSSGSTGTASTLTVPLIVQ
jgi:hypothetical protein